MARYYQLSYQASHWQRLWRVVVQAKWPPGKLFPQISFIVSNIIELPSRKELAHRERICHRHHNIWKMSPKEELKGNNRARPYACCHCRTGQLGAGGEPGNARWQGGRLGG